MVVGIEDGLCWIGDGQLLSIILTINVIQGPAVDGEVGTLVDKRSGLGIGTGTWSVPEGTTEVDLSGLVGIWSRDSEISDQMTISRLKPYTHRRRRRYRCQCKCSHR